MPQQLPLAVTVKIAAGLFGDHTGQGQQGDDIGNGHQRVEYVGNGPNSSHRQIGADKNGSNVKPTVAFDRTLAAIGKIFQAAFAVIIPSEDGGKSEENQAQHENKSGHLRGKRQADLESTGSKIKCKYDSGVLQLTIPKKDVAVIENPSRIAIE